MSFWISQICSTPANARCNAHREAGKIFRALLEQARFDLARMLLQQEDAEVTGIAFELGYSDVANFSRAFKRLAGVPPSRFRGG